MGNRGWMWHYCDHGTFTAPDANGVRHGVILARVPPDAVSLFLCLDGNAPGHRDVEFSNFELLRIDHLGPGAESENFKKPL